MTDVRSIWLLPDRESEHILSEAIRDLAARFDTPVFAPHLTLLGDTETDIDTLTETIADAAGTVRAFAEPIRAIETGDTFFRAFYARFELSPPLVRLKRLLDPAGSASFMPHVSLLYGSGGDAYRAAAAELRERLAGRPIGFDGVGLVQSGQHVPIGEWSVLDATPLRGHAVA